MIPLVKGIWSMPLAVLWAEINTNSTRITYINLQAKTKNISTDPYRNNIDKSHAKSGFVTFPKKTGTSKKSKKAAF